MERLFDKYYDRIYVYIACRVNDRRAAETLTADVFLKTLTDPRDPNLARFSAYVYETTANALRNYFRSDEDRNDSDDGCEHDLGTDALGDLITREEYDKLKTALVSLSERQYEAVYRRYYLGQSFKEIGAALGITEEAVKKLSKRALISLKKYFWKRASFFEATGV